MTNPLGTTKSSSPAARIAKRRRAPAGQHERLDTIVAECALLTAAAWVASWRDALRRDGRVMRGGWPGTLGEARVLVVRELSRKGLPGPTPEQLASASRQTYLAARRAWLVAASPPV